MFATKLIHQIFFDFWQHIISSCFLLSFGNFQNFQELIAFWRKIQQNFFCSKNCKFKMRINRKINASKNCKSSKNGDNLFVEMSKSKFSRYFEVVFLQDISQTKPPHELPDFRFGKKRYGRDTPLCSRLSEMGYSFRSRCLLFWWTYIPSLARQCVGFIHPTGKIVRGFFSAGQQAFIGGLSALLTHKNKTESRKWSCKKVENSKRGHPSRPKKQKF